MSDAPSLGSCCGCGRDGARTIVMLPYRGMVPGHGWGCLICHLPMDGASAVLCDECADTATRLGVDAVLRFACRGYPATDGRAAIGTFTEPFAHDMSEHEQ
jgi:hypothetical protein